MGGRQRGNRGRILGDELGRLKARAEIRLRGARVGHVRHNVREQQVGAADRLPRDAAAGAERLARGERGRVRAVRPRTDGRAARRRVVACDAKAEIERLVCVVRHRGWASEKREGRRKRKILDEKKGGTTVPEIQK